MIQRPSNPSRARAVWPGEAEQMLAIINSAAEAYRGQIPDDCWHEPYMGRDELGAELAAGIVFSGIDFDGQLAAIMGIQPVRNVHLVRHAYVLPELQGTGLGSQLIEQVCGDYGGQILVGTWRAASWAIRFYERHGFKTVLESGLPLLLRNYWKISDRQIETSIVLARPALDEDAVRRLVEGSRKGEWRRTRAWGPGSRRRRCE